MGNKVDMHRLQFAVTLALCLSSLIPGTVAAALSIGGSVFLGVGAAMAFDLLSLKEREKNVIKLCGRAVAASVAVSVALITGGLLGLDTLEAGLILSSAAGASLALTYDKCNGGRVGYAVRGVAYLIPVILGGVIREVLGRGSIFGNTIDLFESLTVGVLDTPAGGMMIYAAFSALLGFALDIGRKVSDVEV